MYVIYNDRAGNILYVFLLFIYIALIQFVDIQRLDMVGPMTILLVFLVCFTIVHKINRSKSKNILDPGLWFPIFFCVTNIIVYIFIYYGDAYLGYFEALKGRFKNVGVYFLTLNAIALIGFYLGNIFILNKKPFSLTSVKVKIPSRIFRKIYIRGMLLLLIATILRYVKVAQQGGLSNLRENYGVDQFSGRGNIGYLLTQVENIFYLCSIALLIPLLFVHDARKKMYILFFVLAGLYLLPSFFAGHRSSSFFFGVVLLINYMFLKQKRLSFKSIVLIAVASICLVVVFGLIRGLTEGGIIDYYLNFFSNLLGTSSVSVASIFVFDDFYYGWTYVSSFLNLIPIYFYGGYRPFISPALTFKELYAPGMTSHGFGFSMFGEAYMNGGAIAIFLFFFFFSIFLTSFFMKPKKSIVGLAMTTIIFIQVIWFMRADSLSFVKILVYSYIIIRLLAYGIRNRKIKKSFR